MQRTEQAPQADKGVFYCFLLLLVWIPLPLGSNKLWASSVLCIAALALAAWWLMLFSLHKVKLTNSFRKSLPVLGLLAAAPCWALLQTLPLDGADRPLTLDVAGTQHEALLGFSLLLIFCLTLLTAHSRQRIKLLAYTIILSGLFQAVYGSMMTLTGIEYLFFMPKESYLGVATGTFVNRNHLAGYLELSLAVGIGIMIASLNSDKAANWRERSRRLLTTLLGSKVRLRLMLIIMVAGLVMTHSRMGNTAFFASMAIAGLIALLLSRHSTRSTVILITSLIVIDIFVVGTFFGVDKVAQRLQNTSEQTESRDEVNTYMLAAIDERLYTGSGAGSFYTNFPAYRDYEAGSGFYDHTHNDYFEFASEYGVIMTGALLLAVLITLITALRAQYRRKNPLMRGIAFSCTMAIIALAIHSTVDFNLQIPANAATFMVILALGWIAMYQKSGGRARR